VAIEPSHLLRVLRRRDLIGILLNAMIGAGMLAAPAKVYALAGDWSFVVLASAAIILIPLIMCFADLSSRFSGTGGPYLYAREALPPVLAFAVGWLLWFSQALSAATLANLFVTYLGGFFPALESGWPRVLTLMTLGVLLTGLVLSGMRQSARASNLLVTIKIGFVLAFLAAGAAFVQPQKLFVTDATPDAVTFAQAVLIYLFAYSGFERGAVVAGEAKNPQHDVPLALVMSVAAVTFAYAAVMFVCVGVLDNPAANDRPLAEAGRQLFGPSGAVAVSAGALAVITGTILVILVSMPRMMLALAEQGQLPKVFGSVHPVWRTPHVAVIVAGVLSFGFALSSTVISALTFATATRLLGYILCCFALYRLSRRPDAPPPRFRLRAPGVVSIGTAIIFTGVLLLGALKELPALLAILTVGLVFYGVTRWRAARQVR